MNHAIKGLAVLLLATLTGCGGADSGGKRLHELAVPTGAESAQPNLAVGADGNVYLSWIEPVGEEHRLQFCRWDSTGWSSPQVIAQGVNWFVNWADYPSMAALEDGTLAAHWLVKVGDGTYAYGINVSISRDGGQSWSRPVKPHRDGTQTEHGFVSMVPLVGDRFGVVWLDGRETATGHPKTNREEESEHANGGPMTLRYTTINREGRLGPDNLIDSRVCDCCATSSVVTAEGKMLIVYRDRSEDEVRDISVVRGNSSMWSGPTLVHRDGWKIEGCPVNGPEIDLIGNRAAVTWFTVDTEEQAHVNIAFSLDRAMTFGAPIKVDDGNTLGRSDLVLQEDGSALVVWMEERGGGKAEIRLRQVSQNGVRERHVTVGKTEASRASGFPRMVRAGERVFLAWTETKTGKTSRIKTSVYY